MLTIALITTAAIVVALVVIALCRAAGEAEDARCDESAVDICERSDTHRMSPERTRAIALAQEDAAINDAIRTQTTLHRVAPPQQRVTYFHAGDMARADLERTR